MRFWPVLLFLCAFGTGLCAQPQTPATGLTPAPTSPAASVQPVKAALAQAPQARPTPGSARAAVSPGAARSVSAAPAIAPAPLSPRQASAPPSPRQASAPLAPTAATAVAPGISIRGQLSLTSGGRPLRSDEAVDAVVYFRPASPVALTALPGGVAIATERKTFMPRVLPVPIGTTVRFPNKDPILHNVFSIAKEANFDLGLYGRSEGESHQFTQPGVIRVFCNVHHAMVAHVLVMDTPYYVKPDAQGRFRLSNLPPGPGELFVWHERAQLWRKPLDLTADAVVPVPLELSKRKVPAHLNKSGQPYRRTRPDEY